MADAKITDCAELTAAAEGDMFPVVDVGTPSVNKRISLTNLRASLDGDFCVFVKPSGSAATDTAAIQAAIDAVTLTTSDMHSGTVLLSGKYLINAPLRVGGLTYSTGNTNKPVSLIGIGNAVFYWAGSAQADDYMLWYWGEGITPGPRIANIYFNCNYETRGIHFGHQAYNAEIRNCSIVSSLKVGIDVDACYNAALRNVWFYRTRGSALRIFGSPVLVENCSFTAGYGIYHSTNGSTANGAIVDYEMVNGDASGQDGYVNGFPAVDEEFSPHLGGTYNQTPENRRAAIVVTTSTGRFNALNWETMGYGHYPLMSLYAGGCTIDNIRCEGNQNSECLIRVICTSSQYYGKTHYIGGIQDAIAAGAVNECKAVIEFDAKDTDATSYGNHVERISGTTITEAVVKYVDGTHSNNRVERCYLSDAAIPMEAVASGAVVTGSLDPVSLPVFANATARDAEWTAPLAGWSCFLTDPGKVTTYSGAAWVIHEIPA